MKIANSLYFSFIRKISPLKNKATAFIYNFAVLSIMKPITCWNLLFTISILFLLGFIFIVAMSSVSEGHPDSFVFIALIIILAFLFGNFVLVASKIKYGFYTSFVSGIIIVLGMIIYIFNIFKNNNITALDVIFINMLFYIIPIILGLLMIVFSNKSKSIFLENKSKNA